MHGDQGVATGGGPPRSVMEPESFAAKWACTVGAGCGSRLSRVASSTAVVMPERFLGRFAPSAPWPGWSRDSPASYQRPFQLCRRAGATAPTFPTRRRLTLDRTRAFVNTHHYCGKRRIRVRYVERRRPVGEPAKTPKGRQGMSSEHHVGIMAPRDMPRDELLQFAQRAENVGFDEIWLVEDLGFRGGIAQAAAVLASTSRIHVGIGIMPAAARNVVYSAMELGTLAELFPSRITAGVGHGMPDWMRRCGAWPTSPLTLLEEYFVALRQLLRGERVTTQGKYVCLEDVELESPPPIPPQVLAGVRGPRSLRMAGRASDGVVLAEPATPEYVREAASHMHRDDLAVVAYNVAAVDDDQGAALGAVRAGLEWIGDSDWHPHIAPMNFAEDFWAMRREAPSRAAFAATMPDEWVRQLTIVGTPAEARARLDALASAGVTTSVLIPVGPHLDDALTSLARLLGERKVPVAPSSSPA